MNNLAVVGSPIAHSKSPVLHMAAYRVLGLDWSYTKNEVAQGNLGSFIKSLDHSWRGLSITMPLKQEAFELAATKDAHAEYTGAVNTLAFSHQRSVTAAHGYNTDVFGITESMRSAGIDGCTHAAIIGGGATALSALVALSELGCTEVSVALRSIAKGEDLLALGTRLGVNVNIVDLASLDAIKTVDAAISTVPGSADVSLDALCKSPQSLLLDVAYDVWPSPRSSQWSASGGVAISGLSMLANQALKQVRIFVSDVPDSPLPGESEIRAAMYASVGLNARGL
ncbi:MAG: hypothetical protein RLZZ600_814 [Actinomycetota bacterium]|jgi:shikimate dehydrogenase